MTWYELRKANRIVSYDWTMYDQGHVTYLPAQMEPDELRVGHARAYENFYKLSSMAKRFPWDKRKRAQWSVYNAFMRKAAKTDHIDSIAPADRRPDCRADAAASADQEGMARRRAGSGRGARSGDRASRAGANELRCRR